MAKDRNANLGPPQREADAEDPTVDAESDDPNVDAETTADVVDDADAIVDPAVEPAAPTIDPFVASLSPEDIRWLQSNRNIVERLNNPVILELLDNPQIRQSVLGVPAQPVVAPTQAQPAQPAQPATPTFDIEIPAEYQNDPFVQTLANTLKQIGQPLQKVTRFVEQQEQQEQQRAMQQRQLVETATLLAQVGSEDPFNDAAFFATPEGFQFAARTLAALRNAQRKQTTQAPNVSTTSVAQPTEAVQRRLEQSKTRPVVRTTASANGVPANAPTSEERDNRLGPPKRKR